MLLGSRWTQLEMLCQSITVLRDGTKTFLTWHQ